MTIRDNETYGHSGFGVVLGGGSTVLQDNVITGNDAGGVCVANSSTRAAVVLRGNTIQNNTNAGIEILYAGTAVDLGQDSDAEAGMNGIRNNSNWNLINSTPEPVFAYRNYWGLTDTAAIDATIFDDEEDGNAGPIDFVPFLPEDPAPADPSSFEEISPAAIVLSSSFPNPCTSATRIVYRLAQDMMVTLRIVDLSGRTVHTLIFNEHMTAGSHSVSWNNRTDAGSQAAPGTYLVSLRAGSVTATKRVLLIR